MILYIFGAAVLSICVVILVIDWAIRREQRRYMLDRNMHLIAKALDDPMSDQDWLNAHTAPFYEDGV